MQLKKNLMLKVVYLLKIQKLKVMQLKKILVLEVMQSLVNEY